MMALAKTSSEYGGVDISGDDKSATVVMKRIYKNGVEDKVTQKFTIQMAQQAGLTGKDNWRKYPARMLKHRAIAFACRDLFPDVMAGIYTPDENEEMDRNIEPRWLSEQFLGQNDRSNETINIL
jgi:hypothetical protein